MHVQYDNRLDTYVAADNSGVVQAIYNPDTYGTVDEFRVAMGCRR